MTSDDFPPEVVERIAHHMNEDHAADNLLIVRALGGITMATAARMSGVDADALEFAAVVNGIEVPVRIPFAEPLTGQDQVRAATVRLCRDARASLGLDPSP